MSAHPDSFLHDATCHICEAHRRGISEVRYEMLEALRAAMGEEGARPWSPEEEWQRLLDRLRMRDSMADHPAEGKRRPAVVVVDYSDPPQSNDSDHS